MLQSQGGWSGWSESQGLSTLSGGSGQPGAATAAGRAEGGSPLPSSGHAGLRQEPACTSLSPTQRRGSGLWMDPHVQVQGQSLAAFLDITLPVPT